MLLHLLQFKPTTIFRRRKERLSFTGDQGINNKPKFIHQPGINKARRSSSTPHEINVLAGLLLQGSDFAVADVEWTIERQRNLEPWRFRTTYNLRRTEGGWRVLLCTAYEEKRLNP